VIHFPTVPTHRRRHDPTLVVLPFIRIHNSRQRTHILDVHRHVRLRVRLKHIELLHRHDHWSGGVEVLAQLIGTALVRIQVLPH